MPSPFPGMDPYLEQPALWSGVHQRLITYVQEILNVVLPPSYAAEIGERLYVTTPGRSIYPDMSVRQTGSSSRMREPGTAGTSVLDAVDADEAWVVAFEPVEVREGFLEIHHVEAGRVVTAIEVLSHANKARANEGRRLYLTKQRELLESEISLLEIDLLRAGEHTVAPPREELELRGTWDYLVSLHRGGQGQVYEVWPVALRSRLPRVRVPLVAGEPDVILDLQSAFDRCYEGGRYPQRVAYQEPATPPLSEADAAWAEALLVEHGFRSAVKA